jgi:diguanylate cyclase (GGDEF)-like protein
LKIEGERLGVMTLLSGRSDPMSDEELMLLQDVAATLSLGLRSQQHADAAQFLTYYDPVSGLAKRALFCERLDALIEERTSSVAQPVVAVFDVRDLSGFNDTYGRAFGDALIRAVAEKARVAAASEFHLGHLGGGTFVLVAPNNVGTIESAAALIDNTVFDQPFQIQGRSVRVACRSGLARYPGDGKDAATLIQKAEAALRQARESGQRYLHFKLEMHSDVAKRLQLEHELREAAEADQFVLHYQPQVSIATGRIEAVEALLRWRRPQGELAMPALFLPMLESSGLIVRVGAWVLSQAAADCRTLLERGLGPVRIAVNVSALQIRRRGFAEDVLNIVGNWEGGYGVDIEITETSILQDLEDTRQKLEQLRAGGIRVAIDDFGTGYSSLGLLSRLPLDILKIDRSFVSGLPGDRASITLTSSIIQIASGLGLVTVAEGVETASQLAILRSFNCAQSQGWLHYKPMPFAELTQLLEQQSARELVARTPSLVDF